MGMGYFNRFAVPTKFMVTYCIVHLSKNEKFNHFVGVMKERKSDILVGLQR